MKEFIHLKTRTSYSLAEGAIKIPELIDACHKYHMPAIGVTDSGNLFASLEFSLAAKKSGIKPIIGCNLKIDMEEGSAGKIILDNITLFAQNEIGYKNLLKIVSESFLVKKQLPEDYISFSELQLASEGIIALSGGISGSLGRLLLENNVEKSLEIASKFQDLFGDRYYIEITRHGFPAEEKIEEKLLEIAYKLEIPIVATNDVFFIEERKAEAHDALLCIADGTYISQEDRRKSNSNFHFKSPRQMHKIFSDLPEAIENTIIIAKRCSAMSFERAPMLPQFTADSGLNEKDELTRLAGLGLEDRLKTEVLVTVPEEQHEIISKAYFDRLKFELSVIIKMDFPGYFLIVSDFIKWSKRSNIPVGPGRGSGAGSVAAWALEITDLDPIRFGLLFERFLNPERISMPDFDIDFCQERRDEVIEYVRKKYGADKVAQIITFGKLQARAVVRDVGRVMQVPYSKVDKISKMIPFNAVNPVTLEQAIHMEPLLKKAKKEDEQMSKLIDIALELEGLNRHASTHAAGIVIADRPLIELIPLYRDPKSDMTVTGYSMKYSEMAGLVKFDFLGLKTLTVIANTIDLLKKRNIHIEINRIPLDDPLTFVMLSKGDAVGVFQFESSGMRDSLRKLKPDNIGDLIALGALYRPGPMDNIPTYIARKHGLETIDYLHPKLENVLKETYGVIIYQEQVMEIAKILAGYSLGAADLLRRAMGKKIKEEMDAQRNLFVDGAIKNNISKEQATEIFDLVAKFAGYGFNKSHAAAYAIISYQTAYLKANYPVEFLAAMMNLDINDTDKIAILIEEAKNQGIHILPPDINKSDAIFIPEIIVGEEQGIRYGLGALKNVGVTAMEALISERATTDGFKDIDDLFSRKLGKILNKRALENLIRAGSLDTLYDNRKSLFASCENLLKTSAFQEREQDANQFSLFAVAEVKTLSKIKLEDIPEWSQTELVQEEFEAIGFYLMDHPLDIYKDVFAKIGVLSYKDLYAENFSNNSAFIAGIVISTRARSSARGRYLTATISDTSSIYEMNIFDDNLLRESGDLLNSKLPLIFQVDVRRGENGIRILAQNIIEIRDLFKQKKIKYRIRIDQNKIVDTIKKRITEQGEIQLSFVIEAENKTVSIDTESYLELTQENLSFLKSLDSELLVS